MKLKQNKLEKEFNELITQLDDAELSELYDECYPQEEEKDLEQEIIEYFSWNSDNPKRQKELLATLKGMIE